MPIVIAMANSQNPIYLRDEHGVRVPIPVRSPSGAPVSLTDAQRAEWAAMKGMSTD